MDEFEIKIVQFFAKFGGKKTDAFLALINSITFLACFWIVLVALAVLKHPEVTKIFFEAVALVAVLHFGITEGIMKHLMIHVVPKRKRPYVSYPESVRPIGHKFSDSSFPSSHMTTTVAMFFVIVAFYPSLMVPAVAMILVMAFSRLHNGMHYPTDIVAGILLGLFYGYVTLEFLKLI